ncbi:MAG: hypothetical protein JXR91_10840 [Deltaproteobacteria bacterium]|nr:hypothetical protein [Deltaproteobacteria bacterium]
MLKKMFIVRALSSIIVLGAVLPNVTEAAQLTAEEKQAQKDNDNLEKIQKKIDEGKAYSKEEDYKKAKTSFKSATGYFNKFSDDFAEKEDVKNLQKEVEQLLEEASQKEDEAAADKKDAINLSSLNKQKDKAEGYIKDEKYSNAIKSIETAINAYDKFSDKYKTSKEGKDLQSNLDVMLADTKKSAEDADRDEDDARIIKYIKSRLDTFNEAVEAKAFPAAESSLKIATEKFEEVSAFGQKSKDGKELLKEFDNCKKKLADAKNADKAVKDLQEAIENEHNKFDDFCKEYQKMFAAFDRVKANDFEFNIDIADAEEMQKQWDKFVKGENELKTIAKNMIEQKDDYKARGMTIQDVFEIYKKKTEYRDKYISKVADIWLDKMIDSRKDVIDNFQKDGDMWFSWVEKVYGENYNTTDEGVVIVQSLYKWIGKAAPNDKIKTIADYKGKIRETLKKAASKNKWNQKDFSYTDSQIKKFADQIAKKEGAKLVGAGIAKNAPWNLVRDEYSKAPLFKFANGRIVLQYKDEDFARGYVVSFKKEFDGEKYTEISSYSFEKQVIPFKK